MSVGGPELQDPFPVSDSPEAWDRLVQALGPASVLWFLERRMGSRLRAAFEPGDLWQDTLLHVWRDRRKVEWRGIRAFRRWVLSVAENRVLHAAALLRAQRRGEGVAQDALGEPAEDFPPNVSSTTPSRVASYREEAAMMHAALAELPPELADVVRLRLLEERSVEETADALGLGPSAVKHRFRKGAVQYHAFLARRLGGGASG